MAEALRLERVGYRRDGHPILRGIDWTVATGQSWVVMGPNGSGKTTLARIASLWAHPSEGSLTVLGGMLGRVDVRSLRRRIAFVSAAMADAVRPELAASDVVVCALNGALEPWWHQYSDAQRSRARELLSDQGLDDADTRRFGTLSSGERQRVLLARALMSEPELLVLDEPAAGLDLGARELLVDRLDAIAASPDGPPTVLVTHHVEEIPPSFTHMLAIRRGEVIGSGALGEVLRDDLLSATFDLDVRVEVSDGPSGRRFSARRA